MVFNVSLLVDKSSNDHEWGKLLLYDFNLIFNFSPLLIRKLSLFKVTVSVNTKCKGQKFLLSLEDLTHLVTSSKYTKCVEFCKCQSYSLGGRSNRNNLCVTFILVIPHYLSSKYELVVVNVLTTLSLFTRQLHQKWL